MSRGFAETYDEYAEQRLGSLNPAVPRARLVTKRRLGMLKVSYELLENLLGLPEDAHIIKTNDNMNSSGILNVIIQSPSAPEITEGAMIPYITVKDLEGWD